MKSAVPYTILRVISTVKLESKIQSFKCGYLEKTMTIFQYVYKMTDRQQTEGIEIFVSEEKLNEFPRRLTSH